MITVEVELGDNDFSITLGLLYSHLVWGILKIASRLLRFKKSTTVMLVEHIGLDIDYLKK